MGEKRPLVFLSAVRAETMALRAGLASIHPVKNGASDDAGTLETATLSLVREARAIFLAQCGPGPERAARATRRIARLPGKPVLIVVAFAGGLRPDLAEGDVVVCDEALGEGRSEGIKADPELADAVEFALTAGALPLRRGPSLTVPRIAGASAKQTFSRDVPRALVVGMEDLGVAQAAAEAKLPWVAVRVVLDPLEQDVPQAVLDCVGPDGNTRVSAAALGFFSKPSAFIQLGRAAARVGDRIAEVVRVITTRMHLEVPA